MRIRVAVRSEGRRVLIEVLLALLFRHCHQLVFVEHRQLLLSHIFVVTVFSELSHHLLEVLLRGRVGFVDGDDLLLEGL